MNIKDMRRTSKFLSLVLRHKPEVIGIVLDEAGWTSVDDLLAKCQAHHPVTMSTLQTLVKTNDKKRFEFSVDGTMIRASQGHSVDVTLGYETLRPPDILYHGTASKNLESILEHGLQKKQRHHVHLSDDVKVARSVGMRYGKPVVLEILSGTMANCGIKFYRSTNGVWLTESVAPEYISGQV